MRLNFSMPFTTRRERALAQARMRAWWDGAPFDEGAALAALEAEPETPEEHDAALQEALFPSPPFDMPPRLEALQALWGEGRIGPGESAEEGRMAEALALPAAGSLALISPGLAAPATAMATTFPGGLKIFEWREETRPALEHGLLPLGERAGCAAFDLDLGHFGVEEFDGLISFDDFAYSGNPARLAVQMAKALKPGAPAILEFYAGPAGPDLAPAFASAFAEPQLRRADDAIIALREAGFDLEQEQDVGAAHRQEAVRAIAALGEKLEKTGEPLEGLAGRELAWEIESWRARLSLLHRGRIERRRLQVRRRA